MESMSLSPDGSQIGAIFTPSGSTYQEFTIYNSQTLQPIISANVNYSYENETTLSWLGYSPDGTILATTGWDGVVRLWDANTLTQVVALNTSPGERLYAGDWSADGRLAVSGTDRRITVWNVGAQQIINTLNVYGHNRYLRWHPDGRQIATGNGEVWDTVTGQAVQTLSPKGSHGFDWSPSGVLAYGVITEGRLEIPPNDNPLGSLVSLATIPPLATPTPSPTLTPSPTPNSGTFPATSVLDNFNRADGAIGGNWTIAPGGFSIASNQLDVGSGGAIHWSPATFGANQEVFVTLATADNDAEEIDLLLKQAWIDQDYRLIEVWYQPSAGKVQVWTVDPANGWMQRGADIAVTFAAGDQFGARAKADGTVEVYKNGTLVGSANVTSWSYYAEGGTIGLWMVNAGDAVLDDFGGGDLP
jgi:WD40 repeat protein